MNIHFQDETLNKLLLYLHLSVQMYLGCLLQFFFIFDVCSMIRIVSVLFSFPHVPDIPFYSLHLVLNAFWFQCASSLFSHQHVIDSVNYVSMVLPFSSQWNALFFERATWSQLLLWCLEHTKNLIDACNVIYLPFIRPVYQLINEQKNMHWSASTVESFVRSLAHNILMTKNRKKERQQNSRAT